MKMLPSFNLCKFLPLTPLMMFLAMMVLAVLSLFGCSENSQFHSPTERIFRLNLATEPPSLDPARLSDLNSYTVVENLMRGLTRFGRDKSVAPAIAERWEMSPDGRQYIFHLRKDARWSDGKPVTAGDFIYGWQRALDPALGSDYAFFLYELKNGKAYYERRIKDFNQVGVHAPNDYTLVVQLERPLSFFPDLLAAPVALPIRRDMVRRYGDNFVEAGHYISNGPYVLSQWRHDDRILLTPNRYYYGPKPGVDAVLMLMVNDPNTSVVMYENNELDFIETSSSIPTFDVRRLRKHPDCHVTPLYKINYFGFNTQKPPFNNVKVRQAFAYALDRSYFPRLLQSGQQPLTSFITPGLLGYNPNLGIPFNPAKAKQLLAEAGYPDGKGFPEVRFAFLTQYDIQKEAEIAQFLWKKYLNVSVRLENMEWKVLMSRLRQDAPQIYRVQWFVDYPDPDSFMNVFITGSGNNNTGWHNPDYDRLVAQAAITLSPGERTKLYDQAQKLLLERATAIIPVYTGEKIYLIKPWVKGLTINALNLIDLDQLTIHKP